jgi:maltose O-acetyltransferase
MNQRFQPDGRSNRERMLAGNQYIANDPDLARESSRAGNLTAAFNNTASDDHAGRDRILRELLGSVGEGPRSGRRSVATTATKRTSVPTRLPIGG